MSVDAPELGDDAYDSDASDDLDLAEVAPKRPLSAIIAGLVLVVLAPLVFVFATSDTGIDNVSSSPIIGEFRPDVSAEDRNGQAIDFADWDGDWIVVNFFATWCVACVVEHPELVEFQERHAAAGDAHMVSVTFGDTPAEVDEFFREQGGDWPVVTNATMSSEISLEFGVAQLPETFLISPDGIVTTRLVGGFSADQADEIIARS